MPRVFVMGSYLVPQRAGLTGIASSQCAVQHYTIRTPERAITWITQWRIKMSTASWHERRW